MLSTTYPIEFISAMKLKSGYIFYIEINRRYFFVVETECYQTAVKMSNCVILEVWLCNVLIEVRFYATLINVK